MAQRAQPADRALGLLTISDALEFGLDSMAVARLVDAGRLRRLQRGVYLEGRRSVSPVVRARAALLAAEPGAVVSGATAARLYGWQLVNESPEQLTIGRDAGHRVARATLRWTRRDLGPDEITHEHGFAVTSPARTLADLLLKAPGPDAVWVADQAVRTDPRLLDGVLPMLTGARSRYAIAHLNLADPRSESPLESTGRVLLRKHGFAVVSQHVVRDQEGRIVARLDLALPELRLGLEADGSGPHSEPKALFKDRRRQNVLVALGWSILRFTWPDVTSEAAQFLAAVSAAVRRLGAAPAAVPAFDSRKLTLLGS